MVGRNTKRALIMSMLSLLLCCAMFIGGTFAWFTDRVTSGNNKIVAGNLDVELEYATAFDGDGAPVAWESVENTDDLFRTGGALWEPGHTEVVYLRIRNAGDLALKYSFSAAVYGDASGAPEKTYENQAGEAFKLSDYLVFNVIPDTVTKLERREDAWLAGGRSAEEAAVGRLDAISAQDVVLEKGEQKVFTLAIYMPTWVGNEANYRTGTAAPEIYIGLTLLATQATVESDSFGNTYDENASYPTVEQDVPDDPYTATATLLSGSALNTAIKKASGGSENTTFRTVDKTVTSITFSVYDETVVGAAWETGVPVDADGAGELRLFVSGGGAEIRICARPDTQILMNADSSYAFSNLQALTAIDFGGDLVSASEATNLFNLFYSCGALGTESLAQTEAWDVSKVSDMSGMFRGCSLLTELDLSGWDTASLESVSTMFMGDTALTAVDLSGWDASGIAKMDSMFANCKALATIAGLSGWSADSVTTMDSMFHTCESLTELDLSGFHSSGLTVLKSAFVNCYALETLKGLEHWDTSKVTDLSSLFFNCYALTELNLPDFVKAGVTNMNSMFNSCKALTTVTGMDSWDTSTVKNMGSMFSDCESLPALDLSGWDTSNVTDLSSMFQKCYALKELTVTGWTVRYGTKTTFMFNSCSVLERIYTDRDWNISGTSTYIFYNCNSLTGGEGTGWTKSNESNANYAKIDREGRKGFFTDIANKP